jgi:uncharacterized protein YjbI with pentapeptide repeats
MASKRPKQRTQRTLTSLLWETLRQEWGIWLSISVLLVMTFLFSSQLAILLKDAPFIQVFDYLSKLGLLIAVIAFLREIPKWEERVEEESKRRRFEYWKAVDAAKVAREASEDGRFASHALKIALESLADEKDGEGNALKLGPFEVTGASLSGIDLQNAHLYVAGFKHTDLSDANFCGVTLDAAYFQRARLFGANFCGATVVRDVSFRDALYDDKTKFPDGIDPTTARAYKIMPKANLQGAMLFQALLWDAQLQGADLRGADLRGAILGSSDLSYASLEKAELWRAKAGNANLQSAGLKEANLQEAVLRWAILRDANLQNADLRGAILDDADLHCTDLRGVRNIKPKQIITAQNWRDALYDDDFRKELDEFYETRSHH